MIWNAGRLIVVTSMFTTIMAFSALADSSANDQIARFSIIETAKGFLRLDQKNGNISVCKGRQWSDELQIGSR